jgi:hypothetical protein
MTGADLIFYDVEHEYWTPPGRPDGRRVWNVTTILKATGMTVDFDALERRFPGTVEHRRQLGSAVHKDAHADDDGDLEWATVHELVVPYVRAWRVCRTDKGLVPVTRERRVFHAKRNYCGTLDGVFRVPAGHLVLIDLKIGDPAAAAAHIQTAAYEAAYRAEFPDEEPIRERWSVQLAPELKTPYRICAYTNHRDYDLFEACLAVFREQPAQRRRAS